MANLTVNSSGSDFSNWMDTEQKIQYSPDKSHKRSHDTISSEESSIESPHKSLKTAYRKSPAKSGLSPDVKNLTVTNNTYRPPSAAQRSLVFDESLFLDSTEERVETTFLTQNTTNDLFIDLVANCKKGLQLSLDDNLLMQERVQYLPKRPDPYSASGSYIAYSTDKEPALIVKPANQEPGAKDCPTGKPAEKTGIKPGESAIRELIARKAQELLGVDLGIPPVYVTTMHHPFFGAVKEVQEHLNALKKKDIDLSMEDLFKTAPEMYDTSAIAKELIAKVHNPILRDIYHAGMTEGERETFISFCKEQCGEKDMLKFKENLSNKFPKAEWITKAGPKIIKFWGVVEKLVDVEALIQKTYDLFRENYYNRPETFVSVQQFEENDCALLDLSAEECKKIPIEEFHKLIIDVIFLNSDRHLGNILVKKVFNEYQFILIDHGYCLPQPQYNEDCGGLKEATYEFLARKQVRNPKTGEKEIVCQFDQVNHPISGKIKEVILQLDINSFIDKLKNELVIQQITHHKYANLCHIPPECYLLIDFNLHLLKKGVEQGRTFREIASFQVCPQPKSPLKHFGGEIVQTFKEVVFRDFSGKLALDYKLLDQRLNEIFASNREQ